jgi:ADP-ribosylation factor-like protein 13B
MSVIHSETLSILPDAPGAYGIRTLRSLRQSQVPSERLKKKIDTTYNYFLDTVDPVIGDLITHLLCEQPIDVPGAMLNYLTKKNKAIKDKQRAASDKAGLTSPKSPEEVRKEDEEEIARRAKEAEEEQVKSKRNAKRPKKEQKLYLATAIGPVLSKLVNRIASTRPAQVVGFLCDELQAMIYGSEEDRNNRLTSEIPTDDRFEMYRGQNGPKVDMSRIGKDQVAIIPTSQPEVSLTSESAAPPAAASAADTSGRYSHDLLGNGNGSGSNNNNASAASGDAQGSVETSTQIAITDPGPVLTKLQFAILGMDSVGKSSIMNMLQGRADMSTKPTIGFRPVTMMAGENLQVSFYDIGGGPKIREIWPQYYHDVHGLIYVVDSSDKDRIGEGEALFASALGHSFLKNKPVLLIANKQDVAGAEAVAEVSKRMNVTSLPQAQVRGCCAVGAEGQVDERLESGLEWLITQVSGSMDALTKRMAADSKVKAKEDVNRRLARERKVLKNKISIAFIDLLSDENKPDLGDKAPNPEDAFTEQEGLGFLSSELGEEVENLPRIALEVAAMVGYQRLALQIVGSLKTPISKKKDPMSWEDIHALVVEIRVELGLMSECFPAEF